MDNRQFSNYGIDSGSAESRPELLHDCFSLSDHPMVELDATPPSSPNAECRCATSCSNILHRMDEHWQIRHSQQ